MSMIQSNVAKHCLARIDAQGMKGAKRKNAIIEFVVGAAAAADSIHGEESPEWQQLSMMAFFVSLNGEAELRKFAERAEA
jgi:hypothetical protein